MESRGPEDSKNVKTSQAYFFEGFISFFEDFSLPIRLQPTYHIFNASSVYTRPQYNTTISPSNFSLKQIIKKFI